MVVGELVADRYELEELVGTGGMSSVFRAHDRLLDRKVALKVLHPQFGDDEEYVERFRREARSVARLSHPNVVTVIDRGEEDLESELFVPRGPGQAVLGCRFLKALIGDDDVALEPEKGKVALVTPEARVALAGSVTPDLGRFLKRECELLSARLLWNELAFRFDAPGFRVAALHLETERFETWEENLDARMERVVALYELLDAKYAALAPKLRSQA